MSFALSPKKRSAHTPRKIRLNFEADGAEFENTENRRIKALVIHTKAWGKFRRTPMDYNNNVDLTSSHFQNTSGHKRAIDGEDQAGEDGVLRKRPFSGISESSGNSKDKNELIPVQDMSNQNQNAITCTISTFSNIQSGQSHPAEPNGQQTDVSSSTNPIFSSLLSLTPGNQSQIAAPAVGEVAADHSAVSLENTAKASNSVDTVNPIAANINVAQIPTLTTTTPSNVLPYLPRGTTNTQSVAASQQTTLPYQSQQPLFQPQVNLVYMNQATGASTVQPAGAGSNPGLGPPNALMLPGSSQQQQQPLLYPIQSQTNPLMNAQRLSQHGTPMAPGAPLVVAPSLPTMKPNQTGPVPQGQPSFTDTLWLNQNGLNTVAVGNGSNERNEPIPGNGITPGAMVQVSGEVQSIYPGKFGINNFLSRQMQPGRELLAQSEPPVQQAVTGTNNLPGVANSFDASQNQLQYAMNAHLTGPKNTAAVCCSEEQPLTLHMRLDHDQLSEYQVLVRKQLEIYVATQEDVNMNAQGRKKRVHAGQIGLMCRHCSFLSTPNRARGSLYFPNELDGLYQAAQNMARTHLRSACKNICPMIKSELERLSKVREKAIGGKQYWADGARALGMYNSDKGIQLDRNRAGLRQEP